MGKENTDICYSVMVSGGHYDITPKIKSSAQVKETSFKTHTRSKLLP